MILIDVLYTGATPGIVRRELNEALRRAWLEVGIRWHRWILPKHFTRAGAREYGYAPRQGERENPGSSGFRKSYTGQKLKKVGHTLPLTYTGMTRALADRRDIRATAKGVTIRLPGRFSRKNPKSRVDMAAEVTAVSNADIRIVTRTLNDLIGEELRKITTVERKSL